MGWLESAKIGAQNQVEYAHLSLSKNLKIFRSLTDINLRIIFKNSTFVATKSLLSKIMMNNQNLRNAKLAINGYKNLKEDILKKTTELISDFKNTNLANSYQIFAEDKYLRAERVLHLFKEKKIFYPDIFRIIGFSADENSFSDAIAYLLNPRENHGLGIEPLKSLLKKIENKSPAIVKRILQILDRNKDLIVVHRERREISTRPDIEILCDEFFILIENKMRGKKETFIKGKWQTDRQYIAMQERTKTIGSTINYIAIFLSPEGKKAKNKNFIPLSVNDLADSMKSAINQKNTKYNLSSINIFLDYYSFE